MINQVTAIPLRFYQLFILNMGLIVAISKELSFLYIISSLIFIAVVIAPLAIWFGFLESPAQIIHEEIQLQMKQGWKQLVKCLSSWEESDDTKKTRYLVMGLVLTYVALNFSCPCIETFLAVNFLFVYFFMHEEYDFLANALHNVCNNKCPFSC